MASGGSFVNTSPYGGDTWYEQQRFYRIEDGLAWETLADRAFFGSHPIYIHGLQVREAGSGLLGEDGGSRYTRRTMEVVPQPRFPAPTGDRSADVAAVVAWHRHVLEVVASDVDADGSEEARRQLQWRVLPNVTGDPAAAYDRLLRWRNEFISWYDRGLDVIWLEDHDHRPTLAGWRVLHKFFGPLDEQRCDICLETDHNEYCPRVPVWYPELCGPGRPPPMLRPQLPLPQQPRFAELSLLSARRWWQFWRR